MNTKELIPTTANKRLELSYVGAILKYRLLTLNEFQVNIPGHSKTMAKPRSGNASSRPRAISHCASDPFWESKTLSGFVRRHGLGREEAQDLVQEFFARLLEHRNLDTVRREKGRLRSYLLVSLKRSLASEQHRARGVKRYESGPHISLDELLESEATDFELAETLSADRLYERRWALAMLEQVLGRLESEYRAADNAALFDRLKEFLVGERGRPTQAEIGTELGMTENAVKQAFHRLRQRYRVLLREEIAHTVAQPGDVEDEMRHLVSVLRS